MLDPLSYRKTRQAFYAGAWAYYTEVMQALSSGNEVTASDIELLEGMATELRTFGLRSGAWKHDS